MSFVSKSFKRYCSLVVSLILAFAIISSGPLKTSAASISSDYRSFVMAPLEKITDWSKFKNQLITLKNNGVYAITTDVWWGDVESVGDNQFNWNYYKTYADTVRASGLKWVPILSTHQCGGNVGDTVNIPLPSWLWTKDSANNMQFKDEKGNYNKEALSPWWTGTDQQYDELYSSFASNFSGYTDIIAKVYLSGGPAGELRFPSYNPALGWTYPNRGYLQCFSTAAETDFRNYLQAKYGSIAGVNSTWGTSLTSFSQITPPTDGDNFFVNGYKTAYGKDFLTWYQNVLTKHLSDITTIAHNRFDSALGVRIGAKVSGIHWLMNSPIIPHAAEYCAGYYNYSTLLDQFKTSNVDLTFTCLEMDDSKAYSNPYYSSPKNLVINIANLATAKGIKHFGENALAISNNNQAYQNTAEMLYNYNFSGFTLLRLANVVNSSGTATPEMAPFVDALVMKPVPVTFRVNNVYPSSSQKLYITGGRWELANWTTGYYPTVFSNANGSYTTTSYLGEGRSYQFKAIMKDSSGNVTWQNGNNQSFTVPTGGGSYTWSW